MGRGGAAAGLPGQIQLPSRAYPQTVPADCWARAHPIVIYHDIRSACMSKPPATLTDRRNELTSRLILDAALHLIQRADLGELTVRAVAKHANIPRGRSFATSPRAATSWTQWPIRYAPRWRYRLHPGHSKSLSRRHAHCIRRSRRGRASSRQRFTRNCSTACATRRPRCAGPPSAGWSMNALRVEVSATAGLRPLTFDIIWRRAPGTTIASTSASAPSTQLRAPKLRSASRWRRWVESSESARRVI